MSEAIYLPKYLSATSLSLWMECPRCWADKYVDKRKGEINTYIAFGQATGKALEALHLGQDYQQEFIRWYRHFEGLLEEKDLGRLDPSLSHGLALLESYRDQGVLAGEPEKKFWVEIAGVSVPIIGYYDLETARGIGEFKTSRATWNQSRADSELQGSLYWLAYRIIKRRDPEHFTYIIMPTGSEPIVRAIQTDRDQLALDVLEHRIREAWEQMKKGEYVGKCRLHKPESGTRRAKKKANPPELILD